MIVSFGNRKTEALYNIDGCAPVWRAFEAAALRKLDMVASAVRLSDLGAPPANRLEKLRGDRSGQWSIRINGQWRICFRWTDPGPADVEIVDYH